MEQGNTSKPSPEEGGLYPRAAFNSRAYPGMERPPVKPANVALNPDQLRMVVAMAGAKKTTGEPRVNDIVLFVNEREQYLGAVVCEGGSLTEIKVGPPPMRCFTSLVEIALEGYRIVELWRHA